MTNLAGARFGERFYTFNASFRSFEIQTNFDFIKEGTTFLLPCYPEIFNFALRLCQRIVECFPGRSEQLSALSC